MKMCVVEFNLQRMGGRQSTMLQFADYFKYLGHEIKFIASWGKDEVFECPSKNALLKYHGLKYLVEEDFDWKFQYYNKQEKWPKCDLYFLSQPVLTRILSKIGAQTVCWKIVRYLKEINSKEIKEFWTNSITSREVLRKESYMPIWDIRPPYSYKIFREASLSSDDRDIDMIDVVRMNSFKEKNVEVFLNVTKELNLNSMLVILVHTKTDLKRAENLPISVVCNKPKSEVAKLMGRAKVFFHPSMDESCSIAIYEALNAGCVPVVNNIGAAEEQLGGLGYLYKDRKNAKYFVEKALMEKNKGLYTIRGNMFDRNEVGDVIKKRLSILLSEER